MAEVYILNNMNKICTSLEQSLKLIGLGIDVDTADMDYIPFANNPEEYDCAINVWNNEHEEDWIPCWSLAALINVLPDTITSNDGIAFKLNIKKNIIEYSNPSLYLIYKSVESDNIVDACVKMILKLHEQKLL